MPSIRFLSSQDIKRTLPMPAVIQAMKEAYTQLTHGQVDMPLRTRVSTPEGVTLLMPAYLQTSQALGMKIVSVFPENTAKGEPIIYALVMALDAHTGRPLAILEGSSLTALRTGAGAGAATDVLARPDATRVAIFGSGVQARTQLEAVCAVRKIQTAWVYSPNRANAERFATELAGQGGIPAQIQVATTPQEAVRDADIICTATTSATPVFDGRDLQAGTHINAVGSYLPTMQEVDETTLRDALITVDARSSALAEAGELIIALERGVIQHSQIYAEIGEVLSGAKAGRTSAEQITYFKSCGIAVQDVASAHLALQEAEKFNIGTVLDL